MTKVRVYVTYKASILDPEAQAIKGATSKMGYSEIKELRMGKYFDFEVEADESTAKEKVAAIANELLANPNMETYTVEILGDN
ncbi:phosphoribosylformylglycinamidine synthase subunit PurS [Lactococcus nasutitermitis]|uniref:Phosphoribosylformylglycinamidine synthase subunit PurS n=1 Tax=Lactococcus nasutitermitis TaxID=1652957 RepID=A0ABV9JCR9_9LACT|nr:phosphoribosylformylglycinamidine synthase subunit PurS [Lactococcus nasutitermitis]